MNKYIRSIQSFRWVVFGLFLLAAGQVSAHPGHALFDQGVTHALTSSTHLLVLGGMGGTLAMLASALRNARARTVVRASGFVLVGVAAALWLR